MLDRLCTAWRKTATHQSGTCQAGSCWQNYDVDGWNRDLGKVFSDPEGGHTITVIKIPGSRDRIYMRDESIQNNNDIIDSINVSHITNNGPSHHCAPPQSNLLAIILTMIPVTITNRGHLRVSNLITLVAIIGCLHFSNERAVRVR